MAHTSVILALFPAARYLRPLRRAARRLPGGGTPVDEMHVTLAYLGDVAALAGQRDAVIAALLSFVKADDTRLLRLPVGGLLRMPHIDEGEQAIAASVGGDGIRSFRAALVAALESQGVPIDERYPTYVPHLTLGYIPATAPTPRLRVPPTIIPAGEVVLSWGDERIVLPLLGTQVKAPIPARARATIRRQAKAVGAVRVKAEVSGDSVIWAMLTKAGERIAGQLCRDKTGKYVNCNSKGATQESKDKLKKVAADQKKQEAAVADEVARKENLDKGFESSGLNEDAYYSLVDFAAGEGELDGTPELVKAGLVEQAADGSYRMTPTGRRMVNAAERGDTRGVADAISLGTDRTSQRDQRATDRQTRAAERETARQARFAERERKRAERDAKKKEPKPKKGGGGGGGGGGKEPPKSDGPKAPAARSASGGGKGGAGGSSGRQQPTKPDTSASDALIASAAEGRRARQQQERDAAQATERRGREDRARQERTGREAARSAAQGKRDAQRQQEQGARAAAQTARERAAARRETAALDRLTTRAKRGDTLSQAERDRLSEAGRAEETPRGWRLTSKAPVRYAACALKVACPQTHWQALTLKHGKHNQASHGRRGRGGRAGSAAYKRARAGGASHSAALTESKAATATERAAERAERQAARIQRLQTQAQRTRVAANGTSVTPAQRQRLLDKADRLDARARGERVGPRQPKPAVTPAGRTTPQSIRDYEGKIRAQRHESALVTDASGKPLVTKRGGKDYVDFSSRDMAKMTGKDAIITHNHPAGWDFPKADPRHNGNSFSREDIEVSTRVRAGEMRAVTPTRTYYVRPPPGGWSNEYFNREIAPRYDRANNDVRRDFTRDITSRRMTIAEAEARHNHEVWQRVFGELGIDYGYTEP